MDKNAMEKNAARVNKYLLSKIKGDPKILYGAAAHLIENGGKRLRPFMVVKSCQILGGNATKAMFAAASVEMIHNFTLVHDDIMDNDESAARSSHSAQKIRRVPGNTGRRCTVLKGVSDSSNIPEGIN